MDSVHIGTQACSLQSSLKLCKLYFCPSVFSMHLFVGSFAQKSHRCTLLYVSSLPLWMYTIRRNNLKCFETSYYSKINAIRWFKLCLHFTLMSRSSAHALQMSNAINPCSKAPFTQHGKRWKHSAAIAFSHFGCVLYSQGGARVMDSRRTLP